MQFSIKLTIGGEEAVSGYYSNSSNPFQPVAKHRADGISSFNGRWFSRAVIENWHTANTPTPAKQLDKKKASACTAYA